VRTISRTALVSISIAIAAAVATTPAEAATPTATEFSAGITAGATSRGIVDGPGGNLWFTEKAGRIGKITPNGTVTEFSAGITAGSEPTDITVGRDGNLWFTEFSADRIGRITPNGTVTEFSAGITAGASPLSIAAGPDGAVWFTEFDGNRIGRIIPNGTVTEYSTGISPGSSPAGITAGSDGNLWFTEYFGNRVAKITTGGVVTEFPGGLSANSFPEYITTGADGNLWFTEVTGNRVGRVTPAGVFTEFSGFTAGAELREIEAGADGNLWVTERQAGKIARITPSGVVTEFSAGLSPGAEPWGITAGPDGNLWFTESTPDKVGRINTALDPPAFANTTELKIPGTGTGTGTGAPADLYPSPIAVSGFAHRRITDVRPRLIGLNHRFPTDVDALLVGPAGQSTLIKGNTAGSVPSHGATLTFSDDAANTLFRPTVSGIYKPSINGPVAFPSPAPAPPFGTTLSGFDGTDPNGSWKLFVVDHGAADVGSLSGGWGLDISTEPVPTPTVSSVAPDSPADDNSPAIRGSAEAGSTVHVFANAACSGAPLASGNSAAFVSPGITVAVGDDTSTDFYASLTDAKGNASACSATHVRYIEDSTPPETKLTKTPKRKVKLRKGKKKAKVRFRFDSEAGAGFSCTLDKKPAFDCTSPAKLKAKKGKHVFRVAAVSNGLSDPSPASYRFKVKKKPAR